MKDTLKKFLADNADGTYIIGHSSALFKISGKLFLADPVWGDYKPYGDNWCFVPDQINCDEILDDVYGCFISHKHADHLCPEILAKLHCPIYIKAGRLDLKEIIERYSEFPVIEVPEYTFFEVGDDIEAYFVPHDFNAIDSSFFIRSKSYCAYHGSDNFLTKRILERIKRDITNIDVALIPYAFIHYYPMLFSNMDFTEKESELRRLTHRCIDQACMFRDELKPKLAVPFGASLYYAGGVNHVLNQYLTSPYNLDGFMPLIAGDYAQDDIAYRRNSEKEFANLITDKILIRVRPEKPMPKVEWSHLKRAHVKLKQAKFTVPGNEVIVNGIIFDLETLLVSFEFQKIARAKTCLRFTFESQELKLWLDGELTLEEAIGTRRFTVERIPNVYNSKVFDFMNLYL